LLSALACVLPTASVSISLSLCLRRFPRESSFLPANHFCYVGMLEGEVNGTVTAKEGGSHSTTGCLRAKGGGAPQDEHSGGR